VEEFALLSEFLPEFASKDEKDKLELWRMTEDPCSIRAILGADGGGGIGSEAINKEQKV